jgi:AraC-like DNA-binding protein
MLTESENRSSVYEKRLSHAPFSVRVTAAGREVAPRGQTHDPAWGGADQRAHHLWFIWKGKGTLTSPAGEFPLRPGACVWMRPGVEYAYRWDASDPLGDDFVVFEMRDARDRLLLAPPRITDAAGRRAVLPEVFTPPDPELVGAVLRRLIQLVLRWQGQTAMAHLPATGPVASVAAGLLRSLVTDLLTIPWPTTDAVAGFQRDVVHEVATRLLTTPADLHRCQTLARQAGYSPAHFRRLFKRVTGQNVKQFALQAARGHAERLLANPALSVTQVAEQLGYPSIYAFSAQFKKLTGLSPAQWRVSGLTPPSTS